MKVTYEIIIEEIDIYYMNNRRGSSPKQLIFNKYIKSGEEFRAPSITPRLDENTNK